MANEEAPIAGSSIASRLQIMVDSGVEQLSVNPVFGDIAVDHTVGRPGYYIHSIITIQTHFGLIGSILFFLPLIERLLNLFRRDGFLFLKFIALLIVVSSLFIEIFTWMPLWFLVGALYGIQTARRPARKTVSSRAKSSVSGKTDMLSIQ